MKLIMENWKSYVSHQDNLYLGEYKLMTEDIHMMSDVCHILAEGDISDLIKKGKELAQSKIGDKVLAAFIKAQAKGAKATGTINDFVEKHMPGLKDTRVVAALAILLAGGAALAGAPAIAQTIASKGALADIRGISAELPEMIAGLLAEGAGPDVASHLITMIGGQL
jgi:hypothetical protein